jgi:hypothetical protein
MGLKPGAAGGSHDATMLSNGIVMVFDNGLGRGGPRVLKVDSLPNEIVGVSSTE